MHRFLPRLLVAFTVATLLFCHGPPRPALADLLVHEPFDYPPDEILTGNGGALGTTGTWYSHDTITDGITKTQDWFVHEEGELSGVGLSGQNPSAEPLGMHQWDGIVDNLATSGGFVGLWGADDWDDPDGANMGEPGRNLDAHISLDPSVTESFESGTVTWFSYVAVRGWDRNEETPSLILATDPTPDESRAASLQNGGSGIGTGGGPPRNNRTHIYPMFFQDGAPHNLLGAVPGWRDDAFTVLDDARMSWQEVDEDGFFGAVNIVVGRIEWDADVNGEDIISVARFLETDELSEDLFEELVDVRPMLSSASWDDANKPDLDQSQFDVLAIAGLKFFVDEIRIATTFEEVVPSELVVPARSFPRGDVNSDGQVSIADASFGLNYLFLGGPAPDCLDAFDANDDGDVNLSDGAFILNFLFVGGAPIPAPGPDECGADPTADELPECAFLPENCP